MLQSEAVLLYGCQAHVIILLQFRREKFQNQSLASKDSPNPVSKVWIPPPTGAPHQSSSQTPLRFRTAKINSRHLKTENVQKKSDQCQMLKCHQKVQPTHERRLWLIEDCLKMVIYGDWWATWQLPTDPWSNGASITTTGINKKNPRTKGWTVTYYITATYCTWYMHVLITWCWNNIWGPIYIYIYIDTIKYLCSNTLFDIPIKKRTSQQQTQLNIFNQKNLIDFQLSVYLIHALHHV